MFGIGRLPSVVAASLVPLLSGCLYVGGGYETVALAPEPAVHPIGREPPLSPTEIRYASDTARVVFRRRASERTTDFVEAGPEGYALCLRSGRDYAVLVFERRVFDPAISQAADDASVLQSKSDTAICRERGRHWIAV